MVNNTLKNKQTTFQVSFTDTIYLQSYAFVYIESFSVLTLRWKTTIIGKGHKFSLFNVDLFCLRSVYSFCCWQVPFFQTHNPICSRLKVPCFLSRHASSLSWPFIWKSHHCHHGRKSSKLAEWVRQRKWGQSMPGARENAAPPSSTFLICATVAHCRPLNKDPEGSQWSWCGLKRGTTWRKGGREPGWDDGSHIPWPTHGLVPWRGALLAGDWLAGTARPKINI